MIDYTFWKKKYFFQSIIEWAIQNFTRIWTCYSRFVENLISVITYWDWNMASFELKCNEQKSSVTIPAPPGQGKWILN
jgi:hypothetical protein